VKGSRKPDRDAKGRLRPTIDSLRVFVELAGRLKAAADRGTNYSSLSEAAEGMASSKKANVFRALAELRDVYGRRPLVNRSTVTLTSEGEAVYTWAKALLELHARGQQWPLGGREQIHIGTSSWILHFLVPEMVRDFLAELAERRADLAEQEDEDPALPNLPDVDLVFGEYDVEQILVALRKGAVHAGLAAVFTAGTFPGLAVQTVRKSVSTVMIAPSQHERWGRDTRKHRKDVALADLAGETVCVIEADLYRILASLPVPTPGGRRILVENYATVAALVRAGVAVGFLPQLHVGEEANHPAYQGLEVYSIKEGDKDKIPSRTLAILRRSGEKLPELVEDFLRVAKEKLG
jgi:DNA-binding transcriptional LysR family regulator